MNFYSTQGASSDSSGVNLPAVEDVLAEWEAQKNKIAQLELALENSNTELERVKAAAGGLIEQGQKSIKEVDEKVVFGVTQLKAELDMSKGQLANQLAKVGFYRAAKLGLAFGCTSP